MNPTAGFVRSGQMSQTEVALRVGELARRVGVSPETLRAWERRYGVLRPTRTPGGYRVYGAADAARAERMRTLIDAGWAASQAARSIAPAGLEDVGIEAVAERLEAALLDLDAGASSALLDHAFAAHPLPAVLDAVVLPVLRAVGDGWALGTVSIAQEHFAADLIGGRLRALSRGWDAGAGPRAVLACPSGERHDLGLLSCGLALREYGWRITYLGADTPDVALGDAVDRVRPTAVVIGVLQSEPLARAAPTLAGLAAAGTQVLVGGVGALPALTEAAGATRLPDDPVGAAAEVASGD
jgi:DNA-binding transcriptional MerR regulator/methylmalonyl-CoA mutase cobalamin-binding subunit